MRRAQVVGALAVRGQVLAQALTAHLDLHRRWNELAAQYRESAGRITSFEEWERTFAENPAPVREKDRAAGTAGSGASGGSTSA